MAVLQTLDDEEATLLNSLWSFWARPDQRLPKTDWNVWLINAGRGYGKTRTGAESVNELIEHHGYGRVAIIGESLDEIKKVMIEGESGIIATSKPWFKPVYRPGLRQLRYPNGAIATMYSAEDWESLRGPQFDLAWLDELAKWRYAQQAFDMLQFGMRLGPKPRQIITTTPRPVPIMKMLLSMPQVHVTKGRTMDNIRHLSPTFKEFVVDRYSGTRLGRQELDAEMLDDNPDALWSHKLIDFTRVGTLPQMERTVIAVDPPATTGTAGIVAAAKSGSHAYVLGDYSVTGRQPAEWGMAVVSAYHRHEADCIVVETNQGGDMVRSVLQHIDSALPIKEVRAFKGKWLRAEPVAALYVHNVVHHLGVIAELEDQMCEMTPEGRAKGKSPDRVDALVYALTELLLNKAAINKVRTL